MTLEVRFYFNTLLGGVAGWAGCLAAALLVLGLHCVHGIIISYPIRPYLIICITIRKVLQYYFSDFAICMGIFGPLSFFLFFLFRSLF